MNDWGRAAEYLSLFTQIAGAILLPVLIGILGGAWVDEQVHTLPLFLLIGLLLGMASGGLIVYRLISRFLSRYD